MRSRCHGVTGESIAAAAERRLGDRGYRSRGGDDMSEKQRKIADWKTRVNQLNQDAEELLTEIKVIRVNAENLYIPEAYKLGEAMDAINVACVGFTTADTALDHLAQIPDTVL
jgi:hypothetical protein